MSPDVCAEPCLDDFDFELPGELIAQSPLPQRHSSRLLHLDGTTACEDLRFTDLPGLLQAGDLLVLNDTRVIPARLFGRKATGGRVEILLERMLDTERARVQIRASKAPKPGMQIELEGGDQARVLGRDGSFFVLRFSRAVQSVLDEHGHMPLPPYIERADEPVDRVRYQTVFARDPGAVAAPTAGLHFDEAMLESLQDRGVQTGFVTLHVGAGTFQPLRAEQLASGKLHAERAIVSNTICQQVIDTRSRGGRVIAVGTTVMRALETAAASGVLRPFDGDTQLFIRPGYRFRVADALLTNFHLPGSSLLMLVCAFAGTQAVLSAYRHAVEQQYRFFSYGDAMFCHRAGGRDGGPV